MDIIFATEKLSEMLSLLEELGEKEVLLVYTKHEKDLVVPKSSLKVKTAFLVKNSKDSQKYAKHYDALIGVATRDIIESKLVSYVYGGEELSDKDKTHFRSGGLNQVLAKLIFDKKKTYVFNLNSLLTSHSEFKDTDRQSVILGRMSFNKQILSKYKAKLLCASMATKTLELRAPKERKLFLETL